VRVLLYPVRGWVRDNPYLDLLYEQLPPGVVVHDFNRSRAVRGRYDIVHVHWPERVLSKLPHPLAVARAALFLVLIAWQRARGATLVWTVHNLEHHERGGTLSARIFWWLFTPHVDALISLTEAGSAAILGRFPRLADRPMAVVPGGTYRTTYPAPPSRRQARAELGVPPDSTVLAFVGLIRPYKNVPGLLSAFRELPDDDAVLLVAGKPLRDEWRHQVEQAARADPRIRLRLGFLPPEDLLRHLAAADLVVLPFLAMFNSGSALLALSFDRPILVPDTSTMRELQDAVGPSWVRLYQGPLNGTLLLETARKVRSELRDERAPMHDFEWDRLAADTVALYRRVLSKRE
jgi:glycosyltransferase involved in cell wall biosynthesis